MNFSAHPGRRVAIIGAGITGLAAAVRLCELNPTIQLLLVESSDRLGGVLQTVRRDGFLIERGADNFITNVPWGMDLCRQIGFTDQLMTTDDRWRQVFVVRHGRLQRVPPGFLLMVPQRLWPLLFSGVLSPWGKLRLLGEYFISPRRDGGDESLASFARRRLGREVFEQLVQPLVSGIYTADPEKLSLAATMPRFLEMERRYGSLLRGRRVAAKNESAGDEDSSGARYSLFVTPRKGFSSLMDALAAKIPPSNIRLRTKATAIARRPEGWSIELTSSEKPQEQLSCDAVVLALPANAAAPLLREVERDLADALVQIPYASAVVVSVGYRRDQIMHPLDGFGFVVPARERRSILAASFSSVKFAGRAPDEQVLIRVFVGGACQNELTKLDDDRLRELACRELAELLGARGEPTLVDIARWPASMAQYHLGHLDRVARIEQLTAQLPGLALAGNAYHGVGISACIHSGQMAAERVFSQLQS